MAGNQIIDKVAIDLVRLVSQFCYDPTNQSPAASVPFQIDRAVRAFAMDFRPSVRTAWALVFSGNQIEAPELRIRYDLFPQRSAPARDDLNHGLHSRLGSAGNQFFCNACFM